MARPDLVLQDNMMCLQNRQPQEFEHQKYVQIRQKTVQILSFVLNGISYISYIFFIIINFLSGKNIIFLVMLNMYYKV